MKRLLIVMIVLLVVFSACTRSQARAVSTWQGGLGREWAVNSAEQQRLQYAYFYDLYGQILAQSSIAKRLTGDDRTAAEIILIRWINEYNQAARQEEGRARWMADDLPSQLNLRDFGL